MNGDPDGLARVVVDVQTAASKPVDKGQTQDILIEQATRVERYAAR